MSDHAVSERYVVTGRVKSLARRTPPIRQRLPIRKDRVLILPRTRHPGQAPDIDGRVKLKKAEGLIPGELVTVKIYDYDYYDLVATHRTRNPTHPLPPQSPRRRRRQPGRGQRRNQGQTQITLAL
ncbi:MAG TPA: hypothetical protein VM008_22160 [Phycisphaerae bacterium]|nr:hypothetical protein [Phycisphaerae bacterium]